MLLKCRKTSQLALGKSIMGMIEGLADDSRSKQVAGSLNGLYPGTKEDLQTEQFSLWVGGHTLSYLLFFIHATFLCLWMKVGWIALLYLGGNQHFLTGIITFKNESQFGGVPVANLQDRESDLLSIKHEVCMSEQTESGGHGGKVLGKSAFWGEKKNVSAELLVSHYTCLYIKGLTTSIQKKKSVQLCLTQLL